MKLPTMSAGVSPGYPPGELAMFKHMEDSIPLAAALAAAAGTLLLPFFVCRLRRVGGGGSSRFATPQQCVAIYSNRNWRQTHSGEVLDHAQSSSVARTAGPLRGRLCHLPVPKRRPEAPWD